MVFGRMHASSSSKVVRVWKVKDPAVCGVHEAKALRILSWKDCLLVLWSMVIRIVRGMPPKPKSNPVNSAAGHVTIMRGLPRQSMQSGESGDTKGQAIDNIGQQHVIALQNAYKDDMRCPAEHLLAQLVHLR